MKFPNRVEITDVTLRDGLQNESIVLSSVDKMRLLDALLSAGIADLEVTSFVSPTRVPQLADADVVAAGALVRGRHARIAGVVVNERGYDRAVSAGLRDIVQVVSATDGHSRVNAGRSREEAIEIHATLAARAVADGLRTRLDVSTAFGCPYDGITPMRDVVMLVERMVDAGVPAVTLCDTVGWADPRWVVALFGGLLARFASVRFGAHFHDTAGYGLANVMAALTVGVTRFDASVAGLGGCPFAPGAQGNLATESLVGLLEASGISTGISLGRLMVASEMAGQLVGRPTRERRPATWRVSVGALSGSDSMTKAGASVTPTLDGSTRAGGGANGDT